MTTEQLKKGKEIETKLDLLKNSMILNREFKATLIQIKFPSIPGGDYGRDQNLASRSEMIITTGIEEWLQEELQEIAERIKSKMEKKIKQLEAELKAL